MSSTTTPSSTSTSSSTTATTSDPGQMYIPSSVISIGIGFVGFAAAFVFCGFFLRVIFVRRNARARGDTPPSLGDIFFASLGGTGLRSSERMHMYMNPDAPWLRHRGDGVGEGGEDFGPKPVIWDVKMDDKKKSGDKDELEVGVGVVAEWKPLSIQPLTIYPSLRLNPFHTKSPTMTSLTQPSGTTTTTTTTTTATTTTTTTTTTTNPSTTVHLISVSLLIAMPSPTPDPSQSIPTTEDSIPDVCFGLMDMVAVAAVDTTSSSLERIPSISGSRIVGKGRTKDMKPEVDHIEYAI